MRSSWLSAVLCVWLVAVAGLARAQAAPAAEQAPPSAEVIPSTPAPPAEPPPERPLVPAEAASERSVKASGFHVFDPVYVLVGLNWQRPCGATAFEFEVSSVPWTSDQLWRFDYYAAAGFQHYRRGKGGCTIDVKLDPEESPAPRFRPFRGGAGVGVGWRFLAVDAGPVYNDALRQPIGWRVRTGISLASELFSGGSVTFSRRCCATGRDDTPCECPRTPVGVALFFYYAHEHYPGNDESVAYHARYPSAQDGMLGLSFKVGFGL